MSNNVQNDSSFIDQESYNLCGVMLRNSRWSDSMCYMNMLFNQLKVPEQWLYWYSIYYNYDRNIWMVEYGSDLYGVSTIQELFEDEEDGFNAVDESLELEFGLFDRHYWHDLYWSHYVFERKVPNSGWGLGARGPTNDELEVYAMLNNEKFEEFIEDTSLENLAPNLSLYVAQSQLVDLSLWFHLWNQTANIEINNDPEDVIKLYNEAKSSGVNYNYSHSTYDDMNDIFEFLSEDNAFYENTENISASNSYNERNSTADNPNVSDGVESPEINIDELIEEESIAQKHLLSRIWNSEYEKKAKSTNEEMLEDEKSKQEEIENENSENSQGIISELDHIQEEWYSFVSFPDPNYHVSLFGYLGHYLMLFFEEEIDYLYPIERWVLDDLDLIQWRSLLHPNEPGNWSPSSVLVWKSSGYYDLLSVMKCWQNLGVKSVCTSSFNILSYYSDYNMVLNELGDYNYHNTVLFDIDFFMEYVNLNYEWSGIFENSFFNSTDVKFQNNRLNIIYYNYMIFNRFFWNSSDNHENSHNEGFNNVMKDLLVYLNFWNYISRNGNNNIFNDGFNSKSGNLYNSYYSGLNWRELWNEENLRYENGYMWDYNFNNNSYGITKARSSLREYESWISHEVYTNMSYFNQVFSHYHVWNNELEVYWENPYIFYGMYPEILLGYPERVERLSSCMKLANFDFDGFIDVSNNSHNYQRVMNSLINVNAVQYNISLLRSNLSELNGMGVDNYIDNYSGCSKVRKFSELNESGFSLFFQDVEFFLENRFLVRDINEDVKC